MKARLIKKDGQIMLLCSNGGIKIVDEALLKQLFICWQTIDEINGTDGYWNTETKNLDQYEARTLAYVTDDNHLCLIENPFVSLMQNLVDDEYITLHEYAELQGKNDTRIKALCRENRIPGAVKKAGKWFIPKHAPYPKDARYTGIEK